MEVEYTGSASSQNKVALNFYLKIGTKRRSWIRQQPDEKLRWLQDGKSDFLYTGVRIRVTHRVSGI